MRLSKFYCSLVWLLRFVFVLIIFYNPLLAIIISLILDSLDGPLSYKVGYSWKKYTKYDKAHDYWWYFWILFFSFNLPIINVLLVLFVYRSIGQIYVLATNKHSNLFWFPNIFENYFIIYVLVSYFTPWYLGYFVGIKIAYPLVIAFVTKIPQEFLAHRKGIFYNSRGWPSTFTHTNKK